MKHPGADQLGAYLDGALNDPTRGETERHLAECAPCRTSLEELRMLDADMSAALTHDPGEAYFETFAARVEDRIRAEGLAGAGARARSGLGSWFTSPRRLAMVGAVAVVVIGAGLVVLVSREGPLQRLRAPAPATRLDAPAGGPQEARLRDAEQAPSDDAFRAADGTAGNERAPVGSSSGRAAEPTHAYEVRRNEAGEDVPVKEGRRAIFAQPPAAPPAPAGGEGVRVSKPQQAEPMAAAPAREEAAMQKAAKSSVAAERQSTDELNRLKAQNVAPATGDTRALTEGDMKQHSGALEASGPPVCGVVRDRAGRPVAGADVTVAETGASARTGPDGRFCVRAPAGPHTLTVLALGYHETRRAVDRARDSGELALALDPVAVLGGPAPPRVAGGAPAPPPTTFTRMLEPEDAFSVLPDAPRAIARDAQRAGGRARDETRAGQSSSAAVQWDTAAATWARLLPQVKGDLEIATRHELAIARFSAWESWPTHARQLAADEALRLYVQRAPAGPQRVQAEEWLRRLAR
jgi:Carboxypeptidase regulatory-like domain/Putative zinc-finger